MSCEKEINCIHDKEDCENCKNKADMINQPPHYIECSLECIEAMELIFGIEYTFHFCLLNAWKYIWRYKNKNGNEDLKKAKWYIDRCTWYCRNCNIFAPMIMDNMEEWLLSKDIV